MSDKVLMTPLLSSYMINISTLQFSRNNFYKNFGEYFFFTAENSTQNPGRETVKGQSKKLCRLALRETSPGTYEDKK